ncbi:MAG: peptide chain release factor-like protein [Thermodesulfovibrio sp.]|nr:peptide chain release factor-like protein [Thermodesulfovibrio sp.]
MGKFPVTEKKETELLKEMDILGIRESDLEERFIRCSGHGGQKVNKTSTGVYLKHIPSGIEVKFTKERSQGLNRFFARRMLVEKIKENLGLTTKKSEAIEKIRKKKQRSRKRNEKREGK